MIFSDFGHRFKLLNHFLVMAAALSSLSVLKILLKCFEDLVNLSFVFGREDFLVIVNKNDKFEIFFIIPLPLDQLFTFS